ncbi:MAG: hypothetical protein QNI88_06095 [Desulfobacterales bacterium]|nr:hypothetical protein [Desulfobacterales bacterium]
MKGAFRDPVGEGLAPLFKHGVNNGVDQRVDRHDAFNGRFNHLGSAHRAGANQLCQSEAIVLVVLLERLRHVISLGRAEATARLKVGQPPVDGPNRYAALYVYLIEMVSIIKSAAVGYRHGHGASRKDQRK